MMENSKGSLWAGRLLSRHCPLLATLLHCRRHSGVREQLHCIPWFRIWSLKRDPGARVSSEGSAQEEATSQLAWLMEGLSSLPRHPQCLATWPVVAPKTRDC